MGLIVMSDLFCLDFVVLSMGAHETDINNLKFVLDGHDHDRGPKRRKLSERGKSRAIFAWATLSGESAASAKLPEYIAGSI